MADTRKAFHETVAQRLIEQLRQGTAPWQKPWQPGEPGALLPMNPITGKRYKGINAIQLMSQGRSDQRWMTYRQAASAGGQVREGEKGTPIQYWKFSEEQIATGAAARASLMPKASRSGSWCCSSDHECFSRACQCGSRSTACRRSSARHRTGMQ
jgi:putative DNA primase/helicase